MLAYVYAQPGGELPRQWFRESSRQWVMVNSMLVALGLAQVSTEPPNVRYQERFVERQREAREVRNGFWADPTMVLRIEAAELRKEVASLQKENAELRAEVESLKTQFLPTPPCLSSSCWATSPETEVCLPLHPWSAFC